MDNLWQAISGAPWWVYVLFFYLMSIGIQSMKARKVPIQRIVLMPLFFLGWACYDIYGKVSLGHASLVIWWVIFLAAGTFGGVKEVRSWRLGIDRSKATLTIPPNYSTIVLIVLIFVLKFFWGYYYATHSSVPYGIYLADTISSSIVTGFFVGRGGFFIYRYLKR
ncbi:MAG: hypothetical protein JSS60_01615 [Verrucomicrobia bacterium]|nr:hypothetical protein [Verrucomicrobiota bacterium]